MDNDSDPVRRKWTAAERAQWIERFRASGLTQSEFAQQQGLNLGTFRQWIYRPKSERAPPDSPQFHEIRLEALPSSPGAWGLELAVGKSLILRWRQPPSTEELLRMLRELPVAC
jgi:transposase-like protein